MDGIRLPEHWNQWTLGEELGAGAYGVVYQAEKDGRISAIKIIDVPKNKSEADALYKEYGTMDEVSQYYSNMVTDFVDEIQTLMSLKGCRNIVQIEDYHVERNSDNEYAWRIYIRMEYLQNFHEFMQLHDFSEEDVIGLGIDICQALEDCEKAEIIHRDIKPDNILVTEDEHFKLGDFGVAKRLSSSATHYSLRGTFTFMSPEVYYGRAYDHRADIYSLGLILYQILNRNRAPFVDPDKQIIFFRDKEEAMGKRISGETLPAPAFASPEMTAIITKACAFDENDRYQSAGELRLALQRLKEGKTEEIQETPEGSTAEIQETLGGKAEEIKKTSKENNEVIPKVEFKDQAGQIREESESVKKRAKASYIVLALGLVIMLLLILISMNLMESRQTIFKDQICSKDGKVLCSLDSRGTLDVYGEGEIDRADILDDYGHTIKRIMIGEGIRGIGDSSFDGCDQLQEVRLPEGIEEIGSYAFEACPMLDRINIPSSLTEIGSSAFDGTNWLIRQQDDEGYVMVNNNLIAYLGNEEDVVIPNNVTKICGEAFEGNEGLKVLTFEGPIILGNRVFVNCRRLTSIKGTEYIEELGYEVFHNTPWLKNLAAKGDGFAILGDRLLAYHGKDKKVIIPETIREISGSAFDPTETFETGQIAEEVIIPENVERIGESAFYCCGKLKRIEFHNNKIKEIPAYAFGECTNLKGIELPDCVTVIGESAFEGCSSLEKVKLPTSIEAIHSNAFGDCVNLVQVDPRPDLSNEMIKEAFEGSKWFENLEGGN